MKFIHLISFRMAAFSIAGTLLTALAIILSIIVSEKDTEQVIQRSKIQIEEQNKRFLKALARSSYNRLITYNNFLDEKLEVSLFYMREMLSANGGFGKVSSMPVNYSTSAPSIIVDDVMKSHGTYASIFRRLGDGTMLRISTSVAKDGRRIVNTRISPKNSDGTPNAIIQSVLAGKKYKGRVDISGEWVNAAYEPIIENGAVVGMLLVSSTRKDSQDFIEQVRDSRYGHVFAVGVDGMEKGIMAMSMEESMASQGKNVLSLKNSKNEYYWQQVMAFCKNMPKNSVDYMEINYKSEAGAEYALAVAGMYYPEWNWAIGIAIPKEEFEKASIDIQDSLSSSMDDLKQKAYIAGIIMFILAACVSLIDVRYFNKTIRLNFASYEKIGNGDMTCRLNSSVKDEMGEMAGHFNRLMDNLQKFMKKIVIDNSTITKAAHELSSVSKQLANGAEETVAQSDSVADTTDQMAKNINSMANDAQKASANASEVASAAEEMSANMSTIASAVDEMSTSISRIENNTNEVQLIANEAMNKAADATAVMNKLGTAAKEIGDVTTVIKKIADKTNLLALNATIEAASAGEYGKGFAVVAGEIKELANQSAESADGIVRRIDSIQSGTGDAVEVIRDVSEIIEKINDSVKTTVSYVEKQNKASNEIASNVAQANSGAKRVASAIGDVARNANDVSQNAGEAARGASDVSSRVVNMSAVAKESAQNASQVNQNAEALAKIASELKEILSVYKVSDYYSSKS